jgi:hypothetical protein
VTEGLGGESESLPGGHLTLSSAQLGNHALIVGGIDDNCYMFVIFRGRTNHRRSADIDVLQRLSKAAVDAGGRLLERVEIYRQQVDGGDSVLVHQRRIDITAPEEPAMDARMKSLDPAVHDLREIGDFANLCDRQSGLAQDPGGAAGGKDFDAELSQTSGKRNDAILVRDADQGSGGATHATLGEVRSGCGGRIPRSQLVIR